MGSWLHMKVQGQAGRGVTVPQENDLLHVLTSFAARATR